MYLLSFGPHPPGVSVYWKVSQILLSFRAVDWVVTFFYLFLFCVLDAHKNLLLNKSLFPLEDEKQTTTVSFLKR